MHIKIRRLVLHCMPGIPPEDEIKLPPWSFHLLTPEAQAQHELAERERIAELMRQRHQEHLVMLEEQRKQVSLAPTMNAVPAMFHGAH